MERKEWIGKTLYTEKNGRDTPYNYSNFSEFLNSSASESLKNSVTSFLSVYSSFETENNIEEYLALYYNLLIQIIEDYDSIIMNIDDNKQFNDFLNIILNLDVAYNKNNMQISIGKKSPLRLINEYLLKNDLYINKQSYYYYSIANQRFYYDLNSRTGIKNINSFSTTEGLSKVYAYRLIEKIHNYVLEERHCDIENLEEDISINLAVFGMVNEVKVLYKYFDSYNKINLSITLFKEIKEIGKYIFKQEEQYGKTRNEKDFYLYNLLDDSDMNKLLDYYNIIIFMDLASFYEPIKSNEKIINSDILDIIDNKRLNCIKSLKEIKNLLYAYKSLSELKNSENYPYTIKYTYDRTLIDFIKGVNSKKEKNSHIYLYVSILDDISNYSYLKDIIYREELFNNRQLLVLRLQDKLNYIEYDDNAKCEIFEEKSVLQINIWKLLKNDETKLEEIFKLLNDKNDRVNLIKQLIKSYLYLSIDSEDNKIKMRYRINTCFDENEESNNQVVIKYIYDEIEAMIIGLKQKNDLWTAKLLNAFYSQAEDKSYIVLSYFWDYLDFSNIVEDLNITYLKDTRLKRLNYKQKAIINNVIDLYNNTRFLTRESHLNFHRRISELYFNGNEGKEKEMIENLGLLIRQLRISCRFLYNIEEWED